MAASETLDQKWEEQIFSDLDLGFLTAPPFFEKVTIFVSFTMLWIEQGVIFPFFIGDLKHRSELHVATTHVASWSNYNQLIPSVPSYPTGNTRLSKVLELHVVLTFTLSYSVHVHDLKLPFGQ